MLGDAGADASGVVQELVTDCSFISSLCIAAALERRGRRGLITGVLHPRDPATGLPTYNPSGEHPTHLARARPSGMSSEALLFLSLLPQASTS